MFRLLKKVIQHVYGKLKNYSKTNKGFLFDELLFIWRWRATYVNLEKQIQTNLKKKKEKKFIFFPLLTEPEIALHGTSDDFFSVKCN